MTDQIVYIRLPRAIIEITDATVSAGLYKDRTEVLREIIRNGMKSLLYHGGGYCIDLKKMVDCCHDDMCAHHRECIAYTAA